METLRVLAIVADGDRPTMETFIGMHRAGVAITVICPPAHRNLRLLTDAGVPVLDVPFIRHFDRRAIVWLRDEFRARRFDVVHTFGNRALSNVLRAAKGHDVRVVAYRGIVGGVSFLDPMSWFRYLNPRIDRIVCVCEAVRSHFLAMRPRFLRMPATRPVTIYKGHRLEWYRDPPAELAPFGVPTGAFAITCVANYRPRKGIEVLVGAIERMSSEIPVYLLLVGHMTSRRLDERIARSPARDRIRRLGYRDDARAITAASDVFCLPSVCREGLSRAVIEAMIYGVPPVVTDCGGSAELVVDGDSGMVVPVHAPDALARAFEKLYHEPELRAALGRNARQRIARDFRHEDTVEATIALYRELVDTDGANVPR